MYKITVKGLAETKCKNLQICDGVSCEDEFTEYFGDEEKVLTDKGVTNGYMHFSHENGKLWTITTYDSPVELTKEELDILSDYTQGQWSDGIGEGFEQEPCVGNIYISAWFSGQELFVEQEYIEGEVDYSHLNKRIEKEKRLEKFLKENDISDLLKRTDDLLKELKKHQ